MTDRLLLSATVRATIEQTSLTAYPEEGCGYLLGHGATITQARPARNTHPGPRTSRYLVDPLQYLQLEEELEGTDTRILGFYHSHPASPAVPSTTDLASALPDLYYLIHDARGGHAGEIRAWRLDEAHGRFHEITLHLNED